MPEHITPAAVRRAEALRSEAERLGTISVNVSNTTARLIAGDVLDALAEVERLRGIIQTAREELAEGSPLNAAATLDRRNG